MNKYFTRGLLASFIVATIFSFGFFTSTTKVEAQSLSLCQTVEALISAGAIVPERANAARTATGCLTPVPPVTPPTSTSTMNFASLVGSPILELLYDSAQKESLLKATFKVSVTAGVDSDISIRNDFASAGLYDQNNKQVTANSGRLIIGPILGGITDGVVTTISAGHTVTFTVNLTFKPSELFAGSYYATLKQLYMPSTSDINSLLEMSVPFNQTNSKTIVGETSPYITSVTATVSDVGTKVSITGVRLQNSTIVEILSSPRDVWNIIRSKDGTSLKFLMKAATGNYSVQVTDPNTGASNIVGFSVSSTEVVITPGCPLNLTRNLTVGSSGADVTALQNFLGVNPANGYFGAVTKAAVTAYQNAHGLSPANGYVGPAMRAFLSKVDICVPPVTPPNATSTLLFVSKMDIIGSQSSYTPGQAIKYSVRGVVGTNTTGTPDKGFNVQAWIQTADNKETVMVDGEYQSVNATFNENTKLWDVVMKAPSDSSRNYIVDTAFYCSRPNQNLCGEKQLNKQFTFTLSSQTQPSITVTSPNGGERWIVGNKYDVFFKSSGFGGMQAKVHLIPEEFNGTACLLEYVNLYESTTGIQIDLSKGCINSGEFGQIAPGNYKIQIYSGNNMGKDSSDSYFKIVNPTESVPVKPPCPKDCICDENGVSVCEATPIPVPPTPVPAPITKPYSKTFSGTVAGSKVFDLGRVVAVSSADFTWTDNRTSCNGSVDVSADSKLWQNKKGWTDVASPASFSLGNLGKVQYIKFSSKDCASYNISSLKVSGTYQENVTSTSVSNGATVLVGWETFLGLFKALR